MIVNMPLLPSRAESKAAILSAMTALVLLSGCQENSVAECQDCPIVPSWFGSISEDCGWAGGVALFIRFDSDSAVSDSSRKYQLHPQDMILDSVKFGTVFTDTLQVCANTECEEHAVSIRVVDTSFGSDQAILGELEIGKENTDDIRRGYLVLEKFPANFPTTCD